MIHSHEHHVLTVVFMRIQVLQVVKTVSLHGWFPTLWRWQVPPKQQELLTKWHSITSQNTQIYTMTAVVSTLRYVPTKVVSRAQEDSTIAHFYNYNVRVLENCTRMWTPAISVLYCQHQEWVYKQPLHITLKYGFLQRETMTMSNQEKIFRHSKDKEEGTDDFWYFHSRII